MEPKVQDLMIRHDAAGSLAFTASAHYGGAIRLRATGRRTLVADHHEHQLHIHLVAVQGSRRELRANKSGSAGEFLAMGPDRQAGAVARVVARAGFPRGCAGGVARFCKVAARAARGKGCDDVTVTVDWTPAGAVVGAKSECGEVVAAGEYDAGAGVLQFARGLYKYAIGQFGLA
ncbi:unnamed protein product [Urochloa humidicola]